MSTNDGSRRTGKGATANSVGKSSRPTEPTRARRTTQPPAPPTDRQRLVEAAHELERLFIKRYGSDCLVSIWVDDCWIGAHYGDGSSGGLIARRECDPWGPRL